MPSSDPMEPEAYQVLTEWTTEPSIWIGMAILIGAYFAVRGPLRARFKDSTPVTGSQTFWFLLGWFVLLFALVSPLDPISDEYLFSAHMVQHILMTLIAPPFLLLGTPGWMLRPFLRYQPIARTARLLTMPIVAFALFNVDFLVWHAPVLYEATLEHESIHILEHLLFISTAVLNWWPILSPLSELPRLPYPAQILYLFLDAVPSTVLGGIFSFASTAVYPAYAAAPRIFGISAVDDQLFAGLIMAMPGAMIYLLALSIVFFVWLGREERAEHAEVRT